jgi:hypothetical protein
MRLADKPILFMIMKVISGVRISVATTTMLERMSPRKISSTITTRITPSISTLPTIQSDASTSSVRS